MAVFWQLLDTETLVFTQFFAPEGTKPLYIAVFFALFEPMFCLDERKKHQKTLVFTRLSKNRR